MSNSSGHNSWLVCYKPNPQAKLRLFCFPYAGGAASIYHSWSNTLAPFVELYSVQLPGRGSRLREAPHTSLPHLIEDAARALRPQLARPFAFFGHSMGATIAFELARYCHQEHGVEPSHLFVSGRRAPQFPESERPTYNLPEHELLDELRRLNGTPAELLESPELMQLRLPTLRADFQVCQTYTYTAGPSLRCPVTAFGGLQDTAVSREHIEGWREHTTGPFALRMLPGDHFFLHTAQHSLLRMVAQETHRLVSTESVAA